VCGLSNHTNSNDTNHNVACIRLSIICLHMNQKADVASEFNRILEAEGDRQPGFR